jgi:hypothetical protein
MWTKTTWLKYACEGLRNASNTTDDEWALIEPVKKVGGCNARGDAEQARTLTRVAGTAGASVFAASAIPTKDAQYPLNSKIPALKIGINGCHAVTPDVEVLSAAIPLFPSARRCLRKKPPTGSLALSTKPLLRRMQRR